MSYEARGLANLALDLAEELGLGLTHMAVHKVLYYAHGWRLAQTGEALLAEPFEAWEYGPVLASVYTALKDAGNKPVFSRAYRFNPVTQERSVALVTVSPEDRAFLRDIVKAYGRLDALTLSDMTHRPGGAWDRVWNAPEGRVTVGMKIKDDAIREEFLK